MRPTSIVLTASLALAAAGLTGCGSTYYRVTDPATNKVYYTSKLDREVGGAVKLRDARTGGDVSLQNSHVEKISKERFESSKQESGDVPKAASAW